MIIWKLLWRCLLFMEFFWVYLWEMIKANFQVARAAFSWRIRINPAIVAIPLDVRSDDQIMILANLVTMTPGSITMDISDDRKFLYAHLLFHTTPEASYTEIKTVLERRIERIFR